eukprot:g11696.t1
MRTRPEKKQKLSADFESVKETIKEQVTCPICEEIKVPIYQCDNGHCICDSCRKQLRNQKCPSCREPVKARARGLENMVNTLKSKCKWEDCHDRFLVDDEVSRKNLKTHECWCPSRDTPCPLCEVYVPPSKMVAHLTSDHNGKALPASGKIEFSSERMDKKRIFYLETDRTAKSAGNLMVICAERQLPVRPGSFTAATLDCKLAFGDLAFKFEEKEATISFQRLWWEKDSATWLTQKSCNISVRFSRLPLKTFFEQFEA